MFAVLSFFSKYFVFSNFSGLWELTFLIASILLEYFVERDKNVMDVCKTRYYEKKCISIFFTGKVTSFRKVSFSTFTQLLQKWSCNLHNTCLNLFLGQWNFFLTWRYSVVWEKTGQSHRKGSIILENSPSAS